VPNGVNVPDQIPVHSKNELEKLLGRKIAKENVLLTLGRLVKRKGIDWFIDYVMPNLPDNIIYIIAGDGPQRKDIEDAVNRNNLQHRIFCLGRITDNEKETLYSTADIFIQPNITVEGDIEGFGLVVLEAASYGLPVIASDLQGLQDAINDGENGFLVPEKDSVLYKEKIIDLLINDAHREKFGIKSREYVNDHFSWEIIAARYLQILQEHLQ
jgi:glycosyltransferase involved in cell wall biosynthesis